MKEKEELKKEVIEIIRSQVLDLFASGMKELLEEKYNLSLAEYEKPG